MSAFSGLESAEQVNALAKQIKSGVQSGGLDSLTVSIGGMRHLTMEAVTLGALLRDAVTFVNSRFPSLLCEQ